MNHLVDYRLKDINVVTVFYFLLEIAESIILLQNVEIYLFINRNVQHILANLISLFYTALLVLMETRVESAIFISMHRNE